MLSEALDVVSDRIAQVTIREVENSYTFGESKEEFIEEFGFEPSPEIIEEKKPEPVIEKPIVEQPKVEVVKQPVKHKPIEPIIREVEENDGPSDKQLRRMAQNLLEENPLLKKGQAHFYVACVRH